MRTSRRIGAAGVGVGVAIGFSGVIGAAVAVPAASANAATSTTYNSTASAGAGVVTVVGNTVPVPDGTVSATTSDSPQSGSLGLDAVESALSGVPTIGPALDSSLKEAAPSGANLVTESATASPDGTSSACAGFLAGDCSDGKPAPITLDLSLDDLLTATGVQLPSVPAAGQDQPATSGSGGGDTGSGSASSPGADSGGSGSSSGATDPVKQGLQKVLPTQLPSGLTTSATRLSSAGTAESSSAGEDSGGTPADTLPSPLNDQIVLTISGPEAACTAGPPGSSASNFTATTSLANVTVDVQSGGKSLIGGPKSLTGSEGLSQLLPPDAVSQLTSLLGSTPLPTDALGVTINPGSTSGEGSGPATSATAGELGLSVAGNPVLDVTAAKATCGPDNAAAAAVTKPATKTSAETPLGGGIQTDAGYYAPPAGDDALWTGLMAGGAALAAGAGGFSFWRRRLHRS